MSFAYDLCCYLEEKHLEWDSSLVENGFNPGIDALSVPDIADGSQDVLYLNQVPHDKTDAVCVYDTGGYSSIRMHGSCKAFEQPTAQIRVRNHSLRVAEETVYRIYSLVDDRCYVAISSRMYLKINAVSPPVYVGEDQITSAGTCYEYTLNVYAEVRK